MPVPIQDAKRSLRQAVLEQVKKLSAAEQSAASAQARTRLQQQAAWQSARSIMFYAPIWQEIDLWPLVAETIASGKTVALPRYVPETGDYIACRVRDLAEIKPGHFGIREPAGETDGSSLDRLDLLLVPGVAFDLQGRRLGRGKGYYDQLLAAVRGRACGVGFDEQIVAEIPTEPHDARLDCLLTPTRWLEW